jgi:hypothetical protein
MQSTTNATASRFAGAFMGSLLLVALLGAPQATAATRSEPQAAPSAASLLARGAGIDEPQGSAPVRALQRRLRSVGEAPGPIDGRFGPLTEAASAQADGGAATPRHGLCRFAGLSPRAQAPARVALRGRASRANRWTLRSSDRSGCQALPGERGAGG